MAEEPLRRNYLNDDEITALVSDCVNRKKKLDWNKLERKLNYLSSVQLSSIVNCKAILIRGQSLFDSLPKSSDILAGESTLSYMIRNLAVNVLNDTRILTALSMSVDDDELKKAILERLQKLVDGNKRTRDLAKFIKEEKKNVEF